MPEQAPNAIPYDLSAEEYYELGTWYHGENDLTTARQALEGAIAVDAGSETAEKARRFLWRNVPRHAIPVDVIVEFKALQSALNQGDRSVEGLERMIREHPGFEWPYKLMADLLLRKGDTDSAARLLRKALDIDPNYAPALSAMALASTMEMDYGPACDYLSQALRISPSDQKLLRFRRSLEVLMALDANEPKFN
jgi:Tfp pilus assembly protein PilF